MKLIILLKVHLFSNNTFCCPNSNDKVFLLSISEAEKYSSRGSLGIDTSHPTRTRRTTNYSEAVKNILNKDKTEITKSSKSFSSWWLRSPVQNTGYVPPIANAIMPEDYVYHNARPGEFHGVVPAITIY